MGTIGGMIYSDDTALPLTDSMKRTLWSGIHQKAQKIRTSTITGKNTGYNFFQKTHRTFLQSFLSGALRPPSRELSKIRSRPQLVAPLVPRDQNVSYAKTESFAGRKLDGTSDREAEASCTGPADYIAHSQLCTLGTQGVPFCP